MQHRHLNHQDYTPAAVDDVIRRGNWKDWISLGKAVRTEATVKGHVIKACAAAEKIPEQEGSQRLTFWRKYVSCSAASVG